MLKRNQNYAKVSRCGWCDGLLIEHRFRGEKNSKPEKGNCNGMQKVKIRSSKKKTVAVKSIGTDAKS